MTHDSVVNPLFSSLKAVEEQASNRSFGLMGFARRGDATASLKDSLERSPTHAASLDVRIYNPSLKEPKSSSVEEAAKYRASKLLKNDNVKAKADENRSEALLGELHAPRGSSKKYGEISKEAEARRFKRLADSVAAVSMEVGLMIERLEEMSGRLDAISLDLSGGFEAPKGDSTRSTLGSPLLSAEARSKSGL